MVIKEDPKTRKASHSLAASIALSARSFGTLSPKKTTFNVMLSITKKKEKVKNKKESLIDFQQL